MVVQAKMENLLGAGSDGGYNQTLLAPTDEAFAKFYNRSNEYGIQNTNELLQHEDLFDLVLGHVLPGSVSIIRSLLTRRGFVFMTCTLF